MSNLITTYKIITSVPAEVNPYFKQCGIIRRHAYRLFQKGLELNNVIKNCKELNNISLLDASLIEFQVQNVKNLSEVKSVTFANKLFQKLKWKKYETEDEHQVLLQEFHNNRDNTIYLRGRKCDTNGNRKAKLDLDNNQLILKLDRNTHIVIPFNINIKRWNDLRKLQSLCAANEAYFSVEIKRDSINISFDPEFLKQELPRKITKNRLLTIDSNPRYDSFIISDNNKIIYKEIIDKTNILAEKNKRKHEIAEITKYLTKLAIHYEVEYICFEKLNMKTKNHNLGVAFNRKTNNRWSRNFFFNSLKKNCLLKGIKTLELPAYYSSFIGQLTNEHEFDSIAAALELTRRARLLLSGHKVNDIIFPTFNIAKLPTRWKEMAVEATICSWKALYEFANKKKSKLSYRFYFSPEKFQGISLRLFSYQSGVERHCFI